MFISHYQKQQIEALDSLNWWLAPSHLCYEAEDPDYQDYLIFKMSGWRFYWELGALFGVTRNKLNNTFLCVFNEVDSEEEFNKLIKSTKNALRQVDKQQTSKIIQLSLLTA